MCEAAFPPAAGTTCVWRVPGDGEDLSQLPLFRLFARRGEWDSCQDGRPGEEPEGPRRGLVGTVEPGGTFGPPVNVALCAYFLRLSPALSLVSLSTQTALSPLPLFPRLCTC